MSRRGHMVCFSHMKSVKACSIQVCRNVSFHLRLRSVQKLWQEFQGIDGVLKKIPVFKKGCSKRLGARSVVYMNKGVNQGMKHMFLFQQPG